MNKRAIIYARVSYDDRDTDGRNLAGQLELGRQHCQKKGYSVIEELAEDSRGASGAEINLPKLNKALEMAKNGLFDVLVVRELDRLSRDVGKLYIVEKELKRYKVGIEYVLNDFPPTPAGQLMKTMLAGFAQFEREEINLRMMRGRRNKINDGSVIVANHGPYGYDKYSDGQVVQLKPNPVEASIIRKIFEWYVIDLISINEIAHRLDEMNAPAPDAIGRKRTHGWPTSTVRKMLHSNKYIGEWGYTYDKIESMTVNIPPIVDRDLWEAAQNMLDKNKAWRKQHAKYEYLFQGRMVCGNCGRPMSCYGQRDAGLLYRYYICSGEMRDRRGGPRGGCKGYRIRADMVDNIAWNWLSDILKNPNRLQAEIDIYQTRAQRENAPMLERLQIIDDLLEENRTKLGRVIDLYISGSFAMDDLQERKKRLEDDIHSLENQRESLLETMEGHTLTPDQVDDLQAFAAEIHDRLDTASHAEKMQLFNFLNVTSSLTLEESGKVLNLQCTIRNEPDRFILKSTSTR